MVVGRGKEIEILNRREMNKSCVDEYVSFSLPNVLRETEARNIRK